MRLLIERSESQRRSMWGLGACLGACLGVLACQPSQPTAGGDTDSGKEAEVVVAWIDGEPVSVEEVLTTRRSGRDSSREARVEATLLDKVASLEARRRKLHERPEVKRALRDVGAQARRREQDILRAALKKEIMVDVEISEEELRQAYEENDRSYLDRQLRLRSWSFESEQEARKALEGGRGPDALDPDKATEVGPFSFRSPPPSYAQAMGRLRRPGERAVIKGDGDWLVVELAELNTEARIPFEEVRDHLLRKLKRERSETRLEEQLQELRASADVRIDETVLSDEELWRGLP